METKIIYGTNVKMDAYGNVTLNLHPCPGHIEDDDETIHFVPEKKRMPAERYPVASNIFVTDDLASAQKVYEIRLKALEDTALHMLAQVAHCRAKYELKKDKCADDSGKGDKMDATIKTLYGNMPADQPYVEDVYDDMKTARREHPDQQVMVGYCIVDKSTGRIVEGTEDWYDTYENARTALEGLAK